MTTLALALVLLSAFLHAGWNLLAKRASSGLPFVWLFALGAAIFYAPAAVFTAFRDRPVLGLAELGFIAGSALIHIAYFLSLQRGYRAGDLSLVYPLARGSGPMLATAGAIALFGERPSALALVGTALVVGGVFILATGPASGGSGRRAATGYGLLTGSFIAAYTLWDSYAVGRLGIPPLLFMWASETVRSLVLAPFALARAQEVRRVWSRHRLEVIGVAVLSPLAYVLVLTALSFTPVSYVAPARETSILVGTLLGARLLHEGHAGRRLGAAAAMLAGVVALALG